MEIDNTPEFEKDTEIEIVERSRTDLLNFTIAMKDDYSVNWHHRKLAKKLTDFALGKIQFLMVFMPPRHGKSELVSRKLPAFLHGLYPDAEIMAASYLDSLAGDMTIDVQNVIDSPMYKRIFPETSIWPPGTSYTKGTRNSSEHHIVGRRGKYRGQGVGGSFTGKGANFIIVDDPIKGREIADSVAFRERLWNFYNNDLFSRLETNLQTGRKGQVLITQTRWHEDDLSGRLLELMAKDPNAAQFEIVNFPAIKENNENPEDHRQVGQALWPEKYDVPQLAQIRSTIGERAWGSLYQQDPKPHGATIFSADMFRYGDLPQVFDWRFITGDTAYKENQENDNTCFSQWGVVGKQLYLIGVWYKQVQAIHIKSEAEPFIRRFVNYGYRGTYIEPKGHGIYLNQCWRNAGLMIPDENEIEEFFSDRRMDKVERANNAAPQIAGSYVIINKDLVNSAPQAQETHGIKEILVKQCLGFPKVKHDDFVDTLIDAIKMVHGQPVSILDAFGG